MATFLEMRNRFQKVLTDWSGLIKRSYKETSTEAVDMNTSQLEDYGIDTNSVGLLEYTPTTRGMKQMEGKSPDLVTLYDTGAFQDSFKVTTITADYMEIYATDWKTEHLTEKYGDDIFGLTEENTKEYSTYFGSVIIEFIKKMLWHK